MADWGGDDCFDEVDIFNSSPQKAASSEASGHKYPNSVRPDSLISRSSRDSLKGQLEGITSSGGGERLAYLEETRDIQIQVIKFKKVVSSYETYVVFVIVTKSCRPEFPSDQYMVNRRYNDFVWLRRRLEDKHSSLLIPPLPEKHPVTKFDRFAGSFIELRRLGLDRFLKRLVEHPVLSCHPDLQAFLTLTREEVLAYQSSHPPAGNILTRFAKDFHITSPTSIEPLSINPTPINDEFSSLYKEVERFGSLMLRVESAAGHITKQRTEWSQDAGELSQALSQWAKYEGQLDDDVINGGEGIESQKRRQSMSSSLETVSQAWQRTGEAALVATKSESSTFRPGMREYALYTESIKSVIRRRDAMEVELSSVREEMSRCQLALTSGPVVQSGSISNLLRRKETPQQRTQRLTKRIETLNSRANTLHDTIACANADLRSDWERWSVVRSRDMVSLLRHLICSEVELYSECVSAWSQTIRQLSDTSSK